MKKRLKKRKMTNLYRLQSWHRQGDSATFTELAVQFYSSSVSMCSSKKQQHAMPFLLHSDSVYSSNRQEEKNEREKKRKKTTIPETHITLLFLKCLLQILEVNAFHAWHNLSAGTRHEDSVRHEITMGQSTRSLKYQ